jgi:hypothetical protein
MISNCNIIVRPFLFKFIPLFLLAADEAEEGGPKTDADFNYDDMPKGDPAASPVSIERYVCRSQFSAHGQRDRGQRLRDGDRD